MPIRIKPLAEITDKWADVTPGRSEYYRKYAVGAGSNWEAGATAAAKTYHSAVTAADIESRFRGGIKRVGGAKYDRKVETVGVDRFGPGVRAATEDFNKGFSPYADEIARLTLPARAPRGDPANLKRVETIATALAKRRLAMRTAGS